MLEQHRWTIDKTLSFFHLSFMDLLFQAQTVHRQKFNPNQIQISTLLSIKTGGCPEDCKYCPQSAHYKTGLKSEKVMKVNDILNLAKQAKLSGSTRFCMGAAWKNPRENDMPYLEQIIKEIKLLGMETCMTLGALTQKQADQLASAGLDYYNHNLDTSPEYYSQIITTRTYQDRLKTLEYIRSAGIKICSGGIIGLGETISDRASLLTQLANLPVTPESIPINMLIKIPGTPLEHNQTIDSFEFIKTIAVARIMMPNSYIRLSAGREGMNEQTQALCFMAGANSIFYGCKLLTTPNVDTNKDRQLFDKLGINIETINVEKGNEEQAVDITDKITHSDTYLFYNAAQKY